LDDAILCGVGGFGKQPVATGVLAGQHRGAKQAGRTGLGGLIASSAAAGAAAGSVHPGNTLTAPQQAPAWQAMYGVPTVQHQQQHLQQQMASHAVASFAGAPQHEGQPGPYGAWGPAGYHPYGMPMYAPGPTYGAGPGGYGMPRMPAYYGPSAPVGYPGQGGWPPGAYGGGGWPGLAPDAYGFTRPPTGLPHPGSAMMPTRASGYPAAAAAAVLGSAQASVTPGGGRQTSAADAGAAREAQEKLAVTPVAAARRPAARQQQMGAAAAAAVSPASMPAPARLRDEAGVVAHVPTTGLAVQAMAAHQAGAGGGDFDAVFFE
jgi:hypothetical protein